jgi:hypothetical protein
MKFLIILSLAVVSIAADRGGIPNHGHGNRDGPPGPQMPVFPNIPDIIRDILMPKPVTPPPPARETPAPAPAPPKRDITFEQWESKFSKKLEATRKNFYRQSYIANLLDINDHNEKRSSFKKGINEYSHLPADQFISTRCKTLIPAKSVQSFINDNNFVTPLIRDDEPITSVEGKPLSSPSVQAPITTPPANYPFYTFTALTVPPEVDWSGLMSKVHFFNLILRYKRVFAPWPLSNKSRFSVIFRNQN